MILSFGWIHSTLTVLLPGVLRRLSRLRCRLIRNIAYAFGSHLSRRAHTLLLRRRCLTSIFVPTQELGRPSLVRPSNSLRASIQRRKSIGYVSICIGQSRPPCTF